MFIFFGADRVRLVDREPKIAILLEITPCWVSPAFVPADIAAPIGPKTLIAAIRLQNVCLADGFWAGVHLVITQTIFCLKELPHLISIFFKYQGIAMR